MFDFSEVSSHSHKRAPSARWSRVQTLHKRHNQVPALLGRRHVRHESPHGYMDGGVQGSCSVDGARYTPTLGPGPICITFTTRRYNSGTGPGARERSQGSRALALPLHTLDTYTRKCRLASRRPTATRTGGRARARLPTITFDIVLGRVRATTLPPVNPVPGGVPARRATSSSPQWNVSAGFRSAIAVEPAERNQRRNQLSYAS